MIFGQTARLALGAKIFVRDQYCVRPGESVLLTADPATNQELVEALTTAVTLVGATPVVVLIPRLPFTGSLADSCIPEPAKAAALNADVWFDLTFPSLVGTSTYSTMLKSGRTRHALVGDLGTGMQRLYGGVDLNGLFELQAELDGFFGGAEGETCRVTSPLGTDCSFRIGKAATKKSRVVDTPGSQTPPGSVLINPVPESVTGRLVLEAIFDSSYLVLESPIVLEIESRIRTVRGEGATVSVLDRALRRAGGGEYGQVIHFTHGFHPAAIYSGRSFMEDIRSIGCNAIGLGIPWWNATGGECHPDGIVKNQSVWIGKEQVVEDGLLKFPARIADMARALEPRHC